MRGGRRVGAQWKLVLSPTKRFRLSLLVSRGSLIMQFPLELAEFFQSVQPRFPSLASTLAFIAPLVFLLPTFGALRAPGGGSIGPSLFRMPMAIMIASVLVPLMAVSSTYATQPPGISLPTLPEENLLFLVLPRFGAGVIVGLLLRLPFDGVRGLAAISSQGLGGQSIEGPLATAFELCLIQFTLEPLPLDSLFHLCRATLELQTRELDQLLITSTQLAWGESGDFFSLVIICGAPILITLLSLDLLLGLVGRFVPDLPIFFLGQPLKLIAACLLIGLGLAPLLRGFANQQQQTNGALAELVAIELSQ